MDLLELMTEEERKVIFSFLERITKANDTEAIYIGNLISQLEIIIEK